MARLREAEKTYPHLRVVAFRRNGGSGTVRRIGTHDARGEIVVWTDADMTYPNERIPELVRYLDDNPDVDQVVGARTERAGHPQDLPGAGEVGHPQVRRVAFGHDDP